MALGICALILSANPDLTAKEVKQILIDTADKVGSPSDYTNGHSLKFGYGRVNAAKAVQAALDKTGKSNTQTNTPTSDAVNVSDDDALVGY